MNREAVVETSESTGSTFKVADRSIGFGSWVRWFVHTPRVLVSGGFMLLLLLAAIAAPMLTNADPNQIQSQIRFIGPSSQAYLGTDQFGRDMYARMLYGARLSMSVSVTSVTIAMVIGVLMGMAAAFFGAPIDTILMRLSD